MRNGRDGFGHGLRSFPVACSGAETLLKRFRGRLTPESATRLSFARSGAQPGHGVAQRRPGSVSPCSGRRRLGDLNPGWVRTQTALQTAADATRAKILEQHQRRVALAARIAAGAVDNTVRSELLVRKLRVCVIHSRFPQG